jgi:hypothetical protein
MVRQTRASLPVRPGRAGELPPTPCNFTDADSSHAFAVSR